MFLVYGIVLITVAAMLAAGAGVVYQRGAGSLELRRAIASQPFCVLLAATMGIGAVLLLAFVIEFETQPDVPLQGIIAAAAAAVGFGGIRVLARRVPPADSAPAADPRHHPA